ncbi:Imm47 family immunity protein [Shewanella baltica]|uniref:Imm47 family immunity protein n=1 Tax=Shewanella baltica TaxID=62322 RepID=UPI00217E61FE|nr:Imm47 family immunity protein [Shewanella baltica]MCS6123648.1 hypothetical protein [Shewanella baltica]
MSENIFGNIPYKACFYGAIAESFYGHKSEVEEIEKLRELLCAFKVGEFGNIQQLILMVDSPNRDVRQYCHQLLAHVCNHDQLDGFRRILNIDLEIDEAQRIIVRLGETLSLNAIPIIFDIVDELDDPELYGYASMALHNIFPWDGVDDDDFFVSDKKHSYMRSASELDLQYYYYRGKPIFIGDVAKELINSATVSYKENKPVVLVRQAQILSNFSGVKCPIENAVMVGETKISSVMSYVKTLARSNNWKKGVKYFYGHEVN